MAKITLDPVKTGFNLNQINANFDKLVAELQNKVLYRDNPNGEPNQWENQQDANSNRLINLPDAVSPSEPATLRQINALSVGVQSVGISRASVTATDGQTVFATSSYVPGTNNLSVYINGVRQDGAAYTETSATSFTLSEGVNAGDNVEYLINEYPELTGTQAASSVTYTYPAVGAVSRNVQAVLGQWVSVKDFGATGNGTSDDSLAIGLALNSERTVYFPDGDYKMDSGVTVSSPVHMIGFRGHKIIPSLGLGGGKLFAFETDDVTVEHMEVDATGETFSPATANTYIFFGGDGTTKYYNHKYRDNKILNASFTDGNLGNGPPKNLLVTHAFYVDNVDDVQILGNTVDTLSGAGVFLRDNHNVAIRDNKFEDGRWYNIHLTFNVMHVTIERNDFLSGTTEGVYWGGAINIESSFGETPVKHVDIKNNYFTGTYDYGAVVRIQSGEDVLIESNRMDNISVGTGDPNADLTGIRLLTRGIDSANKNEPCKNITVRGNYLYAPLASVVGRRRAIFVDNDYWPTRNAARNIRIYDNFIYSPSTSEYWDEGISVHGLDGGVEDVYVEDNYVETYLQASPNVGGAMGFIGNDATNGLVDRVYCGGNTIVDIGTPASSYQYGIGLNAYVDNYVNTKPNYIDNYFYGVRTLANAGPTIERLDDQNFGTNTNDTLFSVAQSLGGRPIVASKTYDPPSLATGATTFTDVTATGASVGDFVQVSFSLDQDQVEMSGYVRTANSVRVLLVNQKTSTVDLASGTLTVRVMK